MKKDMKVTGRDMMEMIMEKDTIRRKKNKKFRKGREIKVK